MILVDTHCHLGDERFHADRADVVARAREAGVAHVVVVADTVESTLQAIALAERLDLSATAGVHPHAASSWSPEVASRIRDVFASDEVVAVGETGLDYHYEFSPREAQRRSFEAQLLMAEETGLPVVVHAREADDDIASMIRSSKARLVLHSFSSGAAVFEAGMHVGAYFSFSGMVTFKNWTGNAFITECPANRLLLETDAPYLAPVPYRGRRNEPAYLREIAQAVAAARGADVMTIADLTSSNATACFGPRMTLGTQGRS